MKKLFRCDYCDSDYWDKEECETHEKACNFNPATKSCETCISHGEIVADTGKVWNTCDKNLVPTDKYRNNFRVNCEGWGHMKYYANT